MGKTYDTAIPGSRLPYTEEARSEKREARSEKQEARRRRNEKKQGTRRSEEREEARSEKKQEARSEKVATIKRLRGGLDSVDLIDGSAWSKIAV